MVNEERLRPMVKIAMLDHGEGKHCKPMIEYDRNDYVSMELLKSFVTGTIAFCLMFGIWLLCDVDRFMSKLNAAYLMDFVVSVALRYGIWLLIYLLITYVVYQIRYTMGRRIVKKYYTSLKKINKIYEREEKMKSPVQSEWE